jgi:hypothetical protein
MILQPILQSIFVVVKWTKLYISVHFSDIFMGTSIYVTNIMKINLFSSTADDTSTSLHRADENVDFDGNYRYR